MAARRAKATTMLKFGPQPPSHVFAGVAFNLPVYLVDSTGTPMSQHSMPLAVQLVYANDKKPVEGGAAPLDVEPAAPVVGNDGSCTLRITINEVSMTHGNKRFRILVVPKRRNTGGVAPVYSDPLTVIRAKLQILNTLPEKWYKDEGGRDKCMDIKVALVDHVNQPVTTRKVPLTVSLEYEDGMKVVKQDILKVARDSQLRIDSSGHAIIRARIEDVSKNHQGQKFRFRVMPNAAEEPLTLDIASHHSTCVVVRSKRNKRQRMSSLSSKYAATRGVVAGAPTGAPRGAAGVRGAAALAPTASAAPATALNNVIQWSNHTVNTLQKLEWQIIGYELVEPDGRPDPHRPIYRCPGCWAYANSKTYTTHRRHHENYATDALSNLHALVRNIHGQSVYEAALQRNGGAGAGDAAAAAAAAGGRNASASIATFAARNGGGGAGGAAGAGVGRPVGSGGTKRKRNGGSTAAAAAAAAAAAGLPTLSAASGGMPTVSGATAALSGGGDAATAAAIVSRPALSSATVAARRGGSLLEPSSPGDGQLLTSDDDNEAVAGGPLGITRGITDLLGDAPSMGRELTFSELLPQPGLQRVTTNEWLQQLTDTTGMSLAASPATRHPDEQRVYYVVAEQQNIGTPGAAFPAFDKKATLLGFYQLSEATAAGSDPTRLTYVPLASTTVATDDAAQLQIMNQFTELKSQGSNALKSLKELRTLDALTEQVTFTHWNKTKSL